jgi:hypothetical protein
MSVITNIFAIFQCKNISQESVPLITFAGTLLSEQQIHKSSGDCALESFIK